MNDSHTINPSNEIQGKASVKTAKVIDSDVMALKRELEKHSNKVHFNHESHIEIMDRIHTREKIKMSKKIA